MKAGAVEPRAKLPVRSVRSLNAANSAPFSTPYACSILAAAAVLLIRERDLDENVARGLSKDHSLQVKWTALLRDRTFLLLFVSVFLFHLVNAPIMPAVALYVKRLGGSDGLMTATS
ncbi:MAG TPA: hypothetical protein VHU83_08700 [Bryobacteraceae bacterium]|jgi:hypothetical protein|nr:hypothetical protein [Bryobacteraceae bacterium]